MQTAASIFGKTPLIKYLPSVGVQMPPSSHVPGVICAWKSPECVNGPQGLDAITP
jgi:hypothetical protein